MDISSPSDQLEQLIAREESLTNLLKASGLDFDITTACQRRLRTRPRSKRVYAPPRDHIQIICFGLGAELIGRVGGPGEEGMAPETEEAEDTEEAE
jgi:hypothetical protein